MRSRRPPFPSRTAVLAVAVTAAVWWCCTLAAGEAARATSTQDGANAPQLLLAGGTATVPVVTSNSNYIHNLVQHMTKTEIRLAQATDQADNELKEADKRNKQLIEDEMNEVDEEDKQKKNIILKRKKIAKMKKAQFARQMAAYKERFNKRTREDARKLKQYKQQWKQEVAQKRRVVIQADNRRAQFGMSESQEKMREERDKKQHELEKIEEKKEKLQYGVRLKEEKGQKRQQLDIKIMVERKSKYDAQALRGDEQTHKKVTKINEAVENSVLQQEGLSDKYMEQRDKREARHKLAKRLTMDQKRDEVQGLFNQRRDLKFQGLCTIAPSCATSWTDVAQAGLLVRNIDVPTVPFSTGDTYNGLYKWTHPRLCCATEATSDILDQFTLAKACPDNTWPVGMLGLTLSDSTYNLNPFDKGDDYDKKWKWAHPFACRTPSRLDMMKPRFTMCLFGSRCPAPWKEKGTAGIIVNKASSATQPFSKGTQLNGSWDWVHPKLCCV